MGKKKRRGDENLLPHPVVRKECLLIQILSWLPMASLLGCKAVCKSWRELIQSIIDDEFHTPATNSSSSNKFGSFILHAAIFDKGITGAEHSLFRLSSEELSRRSGSGGGRWSSTTTMYDDDDDQQLVLKLDNLGFPSCYKFNMFDKQVVGSCNGLVCLQDRETSPYTEDPHEVSLWNPFTREFRILPKSITNHHGNCYHNNMVAFGFDVATKDYKVVLLTGLERKWRNGDSRPIDCFCRVQVYSLSTDSWRLLEGINYLPGYPFLYKQDVLYLNGSCFFLAHFFYTEHGPCLPVNDRFIISFDFTKETITPIQLPNHDRNQELCLCSLGDKIALFTSPKVFQYDRERIRPFEDFIIWALNYEHSSISSVNRGSWTKVHTFQIELGGSEWCIPRGISNDDKFALLETGDLSGVVKKMKLYNFVTNEVKRDFLSCTKVMSKAHAYKPSLISVIGGNGAGSSSSTADRVSALLGAGSSKQAAQPIGLFGNTATNL